VRGGPGECVQAWPNMKPRDARRRRARSCRAWRKARRTPSCASPYADFPRSDLGTGAAGRTLVAHDPRDSCPGLRYMPGVAGGVAATGVRGPPGFTAGLGRPRTGRPRGRRCCTSERVWGEQDGLLALTFLERAGIAVSAARSKKRGAAPTAPHPSKQALSGTPYRSRPAEGRTSRRSCTHPRRAFRAVEENRFRPRRRPRDQRGLVLRPPRIVCWDAENALRFRCVSRIAGKRFLVSFSAQEV
jgi:hypothetical protein